MMLYTATTCPTCRASVPVTPGDKNWVLLSTPRVCYQVTCLRCQTVFEAVCWTLEAKPSSADSAIAVCPL